VKFFPLIYSYKTEVYFVLVNKVKCFTSVKRGIFNTLAGN
jgi:hypothetical protein